MNQVKYNEEVANNLVSELNEAGRNISFILTQIENTVNMLKSDYNSSKVSESFDAVKREIESYRNDYENAIKVYTDAIEQVKTNYAESEALNQTATEELASNKEAYQNFVDEKRSSYVNPVTGMSGQELYELSKTVEGHQNIGKSAGSYDYSSFENSVVEESDVPGLVAEAYKKAHPEDTRTVDELSKDVFESIAGTSNPYNNTTAESYVSPETYMSRQELYELSKTVDGHQNIGKSAGSYDYSSFENSVVEESDVPRLVAEAYKKANPNDKRTIDELTKDVFDTFNDVNIYDENR